MKKIAIFFIIIACFFLEIATADNIVYDIYSAAKKYSMSNKPIFYVIASTNCTHCVHFIKNTITPNFKSINENFVFALSNLENDDKIPSDIPFNGTTPSTYIISSSGEILEGPIEGDFNQEYYKKLVQEFGVK